MRGTLPSSPEASTERCGWRGGGVPCLHSVTRNLPGKCREGKLALCAPPGWHCHYNLTVPQRPTAHSWYQFMQCSLPLTQWDGYSPPRPPSICQTQQGARTNYFLSQQSIHRGSSMSSCIFEDSSGQGDKMKNYERETGEQLCKRPWL